MFDPRDTSDRPEITTNDTVPEGTEPRLRDLTPADRDGSSMLCWHLPYVETMDATVAALVSKDHGEVAKYVAAVLATLADRDLLVHYPMGVRHFDEPTYYLVTPHRGVNGWAALRDLRIKVQNARHQAYLDRLDTLLRWRDRAQSVTTNVPDGAHAYDHLLVDADELLLRLTHDDPTDFSAVTYLDDLARTVLAEVGIGLGDIDWLFDGRAKRLMTAPVFADAMPIAARLERIAGGVIGAPRDKVGAAAD